MLALYLFMLLLGGGLLSLSFFGDFFDGELEMDSGEDGFSLIGSAGELFSIRAGVYLLFGFGATGSLLHVLWGGDRTGMTATIAAGIGVLSAILISSVFGYLRRTEAGTKLGEESLAGLTGEVSLPIGSGDTGAVLVRRGNRRIRIRARAAPTWQGKNLDLGQAVIIVEMNDGIAAVSPVQPKLLADE